MTGSRPVSRIWLLYSRLGPPLAGCPYFLTFVYLIWPGISDKIRAMHLKIMLLLFIFQVTSFSQKLQNVTKSNFTPPTYLITDHSGRKLSSLFENLIQVNANPGFLSWKQSGDKPIPCPAPTAAKPSTLSKASTASPRKASCGSRTQSWACSAGDGCSNITCVGGGESCDDCYEEKEPDPTPNGPCSYCQDSTTRTSCVCDFWCCIFW